MSPSEFRNEINELLSRLYLGDSSAMDLLYDKVAGRAFAIAYSYVHSRSVAEEVVQDSLLKVYRNIHTFKRHDNGYAWICTIVKNTALNTLKREQRHSALNIDDFYSLMASDTDGGVQDEGISACLRSLPPEEQQALWYKYYCDMTVRNVAKAMRIPKSSAQDLIRRAEQHLKSLMSK